MKRLKKLLKKLSSSLLSPIDKNDDSIQNIVTSNYIDRRNNVRIDYPPIGPVGDLPVVSIDNSPFNTANISVGGLCIIDDQKRLNETVGDKYTFDLVWEDQKYKILSQIVGINLNRRHIQFINIPDEAVKKIKNLLKPGFLGSKFRKILIDDSHINSAAAEIWLSPTGDTFKVFTSNTDETPIGELTYESKKINIYNNRHPRVSKSKSKINDDRSIRKEELNDLIICLANFKEPTDKIIQILSSLNRMFRDWRV